MHMNRLSSVPKFGEKINQKIKSLDIDECLDYPCHSNATCVDAIGSFNCSCNEGFLGDGFNNCEGKIYLDLV